jgi:transcriptional regulator of acetoin/glycerol metabolism
VDYWGTGYDWRKVEAALIALPQFITEIDGLDIQFAHIRSPHDDALPLLMTHGWPGSIIELLKVIEPLTDPTAQPPVAEPEHHLVERAHHPSRVPAGRGRLAREAVSRQRRKHEAEGVLGAATVTCPRVAIGARSSRSCSRQRLPTA